MPRYFPVSQDINADPEVWELTQNFGDRALRVWLECLSIADRNKGILPGPWSAYPRVLATRCQSTTRHLVTVCQWLTRWLDIDSQGVARVRNYSKYHKTRAENRPPPNLTEPNLTNKDKKYKNTSLSVVKSEFPPDWKWLEDFIRKQVGIPTDRFLDYQWWDAVSYRCGGLSEDFLEREFAGIKRWILDNPTREPTPKGYRRFVAGWLERAYDKERRFSNGQNKRQ